MTKQELEMSRSKTLAQIYETLAEISKLETASGTVSNDELIRHLRSVSRQGLNALTALDTQIARAA